MPNKNINLLPIDLAMGQGGGKALKLARSLAVSMSAGLILLLILGIGALYLFNRQLSSLTRKQDELRNSIRSLEETESGMVLTRDRLGKIDEVLAKRVVEGNFAKQALVLDLARGGIEFRESHLGSSESTLALTSTSSKSISDLFDGFFANEDFNTLTLNSLQFSPLSGYKIELGVY
jgi:hypothetical protein